MKTIGFYPAAEAEYLSQVAYYERKRADLGALYCREFERLLKSIFEAPTHFDVVRDGVRVASLKSFPYKIFFRLMGQEDIQILSVAHKKRPPGDWQNR